MRTAGENIKLRHRNLTINYDDYGPVYAPAVIFIHGFPFNKSMWEVQTEALKSNYRVISYDVRGYGESSAAGRDFTLDVLTNDLMVLINALQLKRVTVCGSSMGGYIALNAVEKYPEKFNGLVLADTHCFPDTREVREHKLKIITYIRRHGLRAFAEKSMSYFFTAASLEKHRELIRAARRMIVSTPPASFCQTLLNLKQKRTACQKLSQIQVPTLVLAGREDLIVPPHMARYMHEQIEDSGFRVIEHAGHLPNLENAEAFNLHLKKFMDKVSLRRRLSEPVLEYRS